VALGMGLATASAGAAVHVNQTLSPTSFAPKASGKASLALKTASNGRLRLAARKLPAGATFDVVANGIKVGTLDTGKRGSGKARLSTRPHGAEGLLGFEPRGATLAVRDGDGNDVLEGTMPDDSVDPSEVACCLPDDGKVECEDRTADECTAKGGTVAATATCLPNPCGDAPPPAGGEVICCLADSATGAFADDDPEVECEDRTPAECAAQGGTVVQATSCDPNPCAPVSPPTVVVCCTPEDEGEMECELRTPDHCAARNGTVSTATSCDPNPCGGSGGSGDDNGGSDGSGSGSPGSGDGGSHD
jgi:hypothetical protein